MSEEIRQQIDKIKNWKNHLNENVESNKFQLIEKDDKTVLIYKTNKI